MAGMPSPLEEEMREIGNADRQRAGEPAPKPEPVGCQDDGKIVEPLEDVVKHRQPQGGQVVEEADADDGGEKDRDP